jgi:hypothetical protein
VQEIERLKKAHFAQCVDHAKTIRELIRNSRRRRCRCRLHCLRLRTGWLRVKIGCWRSERQRINDYHRPSRPSAKRNSHPSQSANLTVTCNFYGRGRGVCNHAILGCRNAPMASAVDTNPIWGHLLLRRTFL